MNVLKVYFANHKMNLRGKEKEPSNTTSLDPFFGTGGFSNTTSLNAINF
ncbi:hypothetical protein [Acinetobacter variabilis]|nr:hypothetical protein [Acinetobacter variabilis]